MSVTTTASGIKCGNCHHYHENVATVRACHLLSQPLSPSQPAPRTATNAPLATDRQKTFARKLATEREMSMDALESFLATATMGQASEWISKVIKTPKATQTVAAPQLLAPKVPAGRYALHVSEDGTNDGDVIVKFFKVDVPTEGPWKGRTFVKLQASDELYPVRGEAAKMVLEMIAKDPAKASKLYGTELGHCGICGRTLTDETSRANGIGPVCAEKAGW